MEYLIVGLLLFVIGNLTYLERVCRGNSKDIEYIKKRLCAGKKGGDQQ